MRVGREPFRLLMEIDFSGGEDLSDDLGELLGEVDPEFAPEFTPEIGLILKVMFSEE